MQRILDDRLTEQLTWIVLQTWKLELPDLQELAGDAAAKYQKLSFREASMKIDQIVKNLVICILKLTFFVSIKLRLLNDIMMNI